MTPLSSIEAIHYRGIDGLSVPLNKANLVTGANGIGKTALIEAIWLFAGSHNPALLWNENVQRTNARPNDPISRLAADRIELCGVENDVRRNVSFSFESIENTLRSDEHTSAVQETFVRVPPVIGRVRTYFDGVAASGGSERTIVVSAGTVLFQSPSEISYNAVIDSARSHYQMTPEIHMRYSDLVRGGHKRDLLESLGVLSQDIEDTEILTYETGDSYISATMAGELRAIHDLGGGAVRLFRLLLSLYSSRNGILLTDELENGIHHSAQRTLWGTVRSWIEKWNVQFIATTHSAEMIDAAMYAFDDARDDLSIHKLFRDQRSGQIKAATFTGEALDGVRGLGLEVR